MSSLLPNEPAHERYTCRPCAIRFARFADSARHHYLYHYRPNPQVLAAVMRMQGRRGGGGEGFLETDYGLDRRNLEDSDG